MQRIKLKNIARAAQVSDEDPRLVFALAAALNLDALAVVVIVQPVVLGPLTIRQPLPDQIRDGEALRSSEMRRHRHVDALVLSAFDVEKWTPPKKQCEEAHQHRRKDKLRMAGKHNAGSEKEPGHPASQQGYEQRRRGVESRSDELQQHDAARHDNKRDERVYEAALDLAGFSHLPGLMPTDAQGILQPGMTHRKFMSAGKPTSSERSGLKSRSYRQLARSGAAEARIASWQGERKRILQTFSTHCH